MSVELEWPDGIEQISYEEFEQRVHAVAVHFAPRVVGQLRFLGRRAGWLGQHVPVEAWELGLRCGEGVGHAVGLFYADDLGLRYDRRYPLDR